MNPYFGVNFFGFFQEIILRFWGFITGQLGFNDLVTDEIQVLVLVGVAVSSAMLGCFLVLRKMTMLANALSHTILLGIVLAFVLSMNGWLGLVEDMHDPIPIQAMLVAALVMGVVTTFLTQFLTQFVGLQEDASIGIVFTSLFAIGVILVTVLTRNVHIGTEVVMGNADSLLPGDLKLVYAVLGLNIVLTLLFFKEYKITTFDAGLSSALGISPVIFNYLLMTQVSATAIGGFRAVGVLMVLALITGPALMARMLTDDLKKMITIACLLGAIASVVGVAISRHLLTTQDIALSTGGIVVCVIAGLFVAVAGFRVMKTN